MYFIKVPPWPSCRQGGSLYGWYTEKLPTDRVVGVVAVGVVVVATVAAVDVTTAQAHVVRVARIAQNT